MTIGSVVNHVMGNATQPTPEVGMGATVLCYTDRRAGTIVQAAYSGDFTVREDRAIRTDDNGMSEAQTYRYEPDPNGRLYHFRVVRRGKAAGQYREDGRKDGNRVLIGHRDAYHDFSF